MDAAKNVRMVERIEVGVDGAQEGRQHVPVGGCTRDLCEGEWLGG